MSKSIISDHMMCIGRQPAFEPSYSSRPEPRFAHPAGQRAAANHRRSWYAQAAVEPFTFAEELKRMITR